LLRGLGIVGRHDAFLLQERELVLAFQGSWALIADPFVPLLIGLSAGHLRRTRVGPLSLAATIGVVLLNCALTVYPLSVFCRSRCAIPLGRQHIHWWRRLCGALAVVLALGSPSDLPGRRDMVTRQLQPLHIPLLFGVLPVHCAVRVVIIL
jgi:hypothetical protein